MVVLFLRNLFLRNLFLRNVLEKVRLNSVIGFGFVSLILTLSLAGCAASNGSFQCPNTGGVMCKRLDQVNSMVDKGEIGTTSFNEGEENYVTIKNNGKAGAFGNFSKPFATTLTPGEPLRYGETVLRIWVAPFVDKDGNYHHQSYVDTVVKPGHWIGNPIFTKKGF